MWMSHPSGRFKTSHVQSIACWRFSSSLSKLQFLLQLLDLMLVYCFKGNFESIILPCYSPAEVHLGIMTAQKR